MFFKLSLKNIKKSFKDYSIYFLTLIFGVAIFYIFNSMDSQTAMLTITESKSSMLELLNEVLGYISIFISFILGFLIVYANNFLIRRRKKEFGIYMTLGMGKGKISKLLLVETILIGIISLAIGLLLGIFGSQFMSVFVAKMFEANMDSYQFAFSSGALVKTMLYFGVIYVFVMIFNTFAISRCKLIDLLTAARKNEKIKMKNPVVAVILFIMSIACLGTAYYFVFAEKVMNTIAIFDLTILLGVVGTFLFFASLSGFILRLIQSCKRIYLKNLNMFVLRQITSKINTTVVSMGFICLMLFLTICILSSAWTMNDTTNRQMKKLAPVDISVNKSIDNTENGRLSNIEVLEKLGFDTTKLKEYLEVPIYSSPEVTQKDTFGIIIDKLQEKYGHINFESEEEIMSVSDYNKVAEMFGNEKISLNDNQYSIVCNVETMKEERNEALKLNTVLSINGKEYLPAQANVVYGFTQIAPNPMTTGIVVLPDNVVEQFSIYKMDFNANYVDNISEEEKQQLENMLDEVIQNRDVGLFTLTKQGLYDSAIGLSALITFIGLYLGIIFLITSAAVLALKELSESSDNKARYTILRKIGVDEKMINKSIFTQIGIFFMVPLLLAIVHSIVGMFFANSVLTMFGKADILPSIAITAGFIILIYGGYFVATYFGSKAIIKESDRS